MTAETLLDRLEKVRPNGRNKWMACCPAHSDKSPSLSITENEAGKVLINCFAGCSGADVVAAVGLEWADLMPYEERQKPHRKPPQRKTDLDIAIESRLGFLTQTDTERLVLDLFNLMPREERTREDIERAMLAMERLGIRRKLA